MAKDVFAVPSCKENMMNKTWKVLCKFVIASDQIMFLLAVRINSGGGTVLLMLLLLFIVVTVDVDAAFAVVVTAVGTSTFSF